MVLKDVEMIWLGKGWNGYFLLFGESGWKGVLKGWDGIEKGNMVVWEDRVELVKMEWFLGRVNRGEREVVFV